MTGFSELSNVVSIFMTAGNLLTSTVNVGTSVTNLVNYKNIKLVQLIFVP
jgi:hypothetical protein